MNLKKKSRVFEESVNNNGGLRCQDRKEKKESRC